MKDLPTLSDEMIDHNTNFGKDIRAQLELLLLEQYSPLLLFE
jgi:hypothetical protein